MVHAFLNFACTITFSDCKCLGLITREGEGNPLRPYVAEQRPRRTNLSCCLGLSDNGQQKSTTRLVVLVPHEYLMEIAGTHRVGYQGREEESVPRPWKPELAY